MITKEMEIEELVNSYPFSVRYLMTQQIKCIACGEPIWGTLEEAAQDKGYNAEQIEHFVSELNKLASANPTSD
jgi:methionine synthase II (cobalamin-independent)